MVVTRVIEWGHTITYKVIDRGMIEEIGPTGIVKVIGGLARRASGGQTGQIGQYSLVIIIGTIGMIIYQSL